MIIAGSVKLGYLQAYLGGPCLNKQITKIYILCVNLMYFRIVMYLGLDFCPGKTLVSGKFSGCGGLPDLLQGIILRDVNSRQNLGPTISF